MDRITIKSMSLVALVFLFTINTRYINFDLFIISLDLPKMLTIVICIMTVLKALKSNHLSFTFNRSLTFLLLGFIIWGLISIFWTPSVSLAGTEIVNLTITLILVFIMRNSSAYHLAIGWMMGYSINLLIALWELATNNHLPGSDYVNNPINYIALQGKIVLATFNNPNDYSAFLLLSNAIFYFLIRERRNALIQIIPFICMNTLLLFFAAGRLGIFGSVVFLVLISILSKKTINSFIQMSILFLASIGAYSYAYASNNLAIKKLNSALVVGQDESIISRINLSLNGMHFLVSTNGLGVGAGGYKYYAESPNLPYYTYGIINPHNFWIEIASQYGLVVFFAFVCWILFHLNRSLLFMSFADRRNTCIFIIIAISVYSIAVIQSSSYINSFSNWIFLIIVGSASGSLGRKRGNHAN